MSLTQAFAIQPTYERELGGGKLTIGTFLIVLVIGEVVIYWGLSSGRNPPEYFGTAVAFLLALPVFAYFLVRSARNGKEKLVTFVNSASDVIRSWACVGPLIETGGYEADCELSNGCYMQCLFGIMSGDEDKSGIIRIFRFIKGPEALNQAPLFKARIDGKTLKTARIPAKEEAFDSWRQSETSWKRLVSMDESVRSWAVAHVFWKGSRFRQPFSGDVLNVSVVCHDLYLRSPSREGEWLKGKTLGVTLQFFEPIGQDEIKDFYSELITTADKIIQYVEGSLIGKK